MFLPHPAKLIYFPRAILEFVEINIFFLKKQLPIFIIQGLPSVLGIAFRI